MTNEEFRQALRFVAKVIEIANDPVAMARLEMLRAEADGTLEWMKQFSPVEGYEKAAKRGTCPSCGHKYSLNNDESLRRHRDTRYGREKCHLDKQLPAEIIPAVLVIAELSGSDGGAESDDGAHEQSNGNNV